jgi:predicted transcriptional regulator
VSRPSPEMLKPLFRTAQNAKQSARGSVKKLKNSSHFYTFAKKTKKNLVAESMCTVRKIYEFSLYVYR